MDDGSEDPQEIFVSKCAQPQGEVILYYTRLLNTTLFKYPPRNPTFENFIYKLQQLLLMKIS